MDKKLYIDITEIMLGLGLNPKYIGFEYLRSAVEVFYRKNDLEERLTTEIYPKVAERFETTIVVVERSIRMLILDSYNSGGLMNINEYYGSVVIDNKTVLSNGELIAIIAEIIRLRKIRERLKNKDIS